MSEEFRADIHCHTNCSDGSDDPIALLHLAKTVGLQGLSITDHDTLSGYTPKLFETAKELGIEILPGIEISSEWERSSVHILGYGFDLEDIAFRTFLEEMQRRRTERNRGILEKLAKFKMPISEKELQALAEQLPYQKTIGRPHIAQLMIQKGYVSTTQEAFEKYLKEGACCYSPGIKYTPRDVIEKIHLAKGKAVLAHPHFIKRGHFLKSLLSLPLDGIECYYAKLPKAQEIPWLQMAKDRNWIATGGSDYHGALKPRITLGCSWVNRTIFDKLLNP
jgi:hypothetical protein